MNRVLQLNEVRENELWEGYKILDRAKGHIYRGAGDRASEILQALMDLLVAMARCKDWSK